MWRSKSLRNCGHAEPARRIEGLPLPVLGGHIEQREEGRERGLQGPIEGQQFAGELLADFPAFAGVDAFESRTGKGVVGRVDARFVALGTKALLDELGIHPEGLAGTAEALRADGETVVFVAVDGTVIGLIGVTDPIKTTTPEAIEQLHREGLRIVMLTGDSRTTAEAVAKKLRLDEVVAEVLPDQKVDVVKAPSAGGPRCGHGR